MDRQWVEIAKEQYDRMVCTSYTGGSSWFYDPQISGATFVLHGSTPVQARRSFIGNGSDYKLTMERIDRPAKS